MKEWEVCLTYSLIDCTLSAYLALFARGFVDEDGDGRISREELPIWSRNLGKVVDGGKLFDFGLQSVFSTLIEAWSFAVTYGVITTFLMNQLLVGWISKEWGW